MRGSGGPFPILKVDGLGVSYGGVAALSGVSFAVDPGEAVAVIGPNGSGKTTLFNLLSGRVRIQAGTVCFEGRKISRKPPHRIARLGISRTFQEVRLFRRFTVLENLLFALRQGQAESLVGALFPLGQSLARRQAIETAEAWLERIGLFEKRDALAKDLSYGQGKLLEIARMLCIKPRLVLLDEPAAGLSPAALQMFYALLRDDRAKGLTVLFVEHNLGVVQELADRAMVLDAGRLIAVGRPDLVRQHPAVQDAYAGRGQRAHA